MKSTQQVPHLEVDEPSYFFRLKSKVAMVKLYEAPLSATRCQYKSKRKRPARKTETSRYRTLYRHPQLAGFQRLILSCLVTQQVPVLKLGENRPNFPIH